MSISIYLLNNYKFAIKIETTTELQKVGSPFFSITVMSN